MAHLRTPLYDWHLSHAARIVPFGGWDMPVHYKDGIVAEHHAVRNMCGIFDVSHMGRLTFEGPDALSLIQHVWTNDAAAMKPGQVRYGLLCNDQGGILDDVLVYRLDAFWLMVVNAANRERIVAWLHQHAHGRDVVLTDRTFDWAMIAVQGPRAIETCPEAAALKYYTASVSELPDDYGWQILSRTGYTGEDGYELIVPARRIEEVCFVLTEKQVAWRFGFPVVMCGLGARDTLRLEAAMPLYGHELSEHIDPFQAGLDWAVKLAKPAFVGREALQAVSAHPDRLVRVGLRLLSRRIAREGAIVFHAGQECGRVTSGTLSPTLDRSIAMAYVASTAAAMGTALEVDIRGTREAAEVVPLPFYRRPR